MAKYQIETDEGIFEVEVEEPQKTTAEGALSIAKEASGVPYFERQLGEVSTDIYVPKFLDKNQTLVEKSIDFAKRMLPSPTFPITNPVSRYLESKGQQVEGSVEDIAGRIAEKQMPMTATALSMFAPTLTPSGAIMGTGLGLLTGFGTFPRSAKVPLRTPSVVEKGLETTTKGLGEEGLLPEQVGKTVRENFPVVREMPSGKQMFEPVYRGMAEGISKESVPLTKSGEVIKKGYQSRLNKLRVSERKAFAKLEQDNALKNAPAQLENSRQFIEDLFQRNQINETNQQGISLDMIRKQFPNYVPPQTAESIGAMAEAQPTIPRSDIGIFSRILRMASRDDLTANDIKLLRTDVGYEISKANGWDAPRTNEPIFRLKQIYEKLGDDYLKAADEAGLKDQVIKANKATKDLYGFLDKPSSRIIGDTEYVSKLQNKLIDTKSPERITELFKEHNLSPNDINVVRRGVLDELFRRSDGDPVKFGKEWNKYTPEVKKELMGDKSKLIDSISEVQKISDKIEGDILKSDAYTLNKKFSKVVNSEVVDSILKDGTPELADQLVKNLNKNSIKVIRRGIINRLIEQSKTEGTKQSKLNYDDINRNFNKLDDQFINKMFGEDAKTVKAIKDSSKLYEEKLGEARIGRSLPSRTGFMIQWIKGLATRFKIPSEVYSMVKRTSESNEIAGQIVPKTKTNLLPRIGRSNLLNQYPFVYGKTPIVREE